MPEAAYFVMAVFWPVRAFPLRPYDRHHCAIVPGTGRRSHLSHERFSFHWFGELFKEQRVGISRDRSCVPLHGTIVMILTVVISLSAGLAYRKPFRFAGAIFYVTVASLIVPSILITLGIGLMFDRLGLDAGWYTSGMGAHLTWTLPSAF